MRKATLTTGRRAGHYARLATLAASVAFCGTHVASGQVMDPLRGYNLNGDTVGPQQRETRAARTRDTAAEPQAEVQRARPVMASAGRMRRIAEGQGLHLLTVPHRRGRGVFAMAANEAGHRIQLTFNPYSGFIVGQRDLGAPQTSVAETKKAPDTAPVVAVAAAKPEPGAAVPPAPDDAEIAGAKAAVDKARMAESEAKHEAETAAAESRRATAKLAELEAAARRATEIKAQEARRQEQMAAEQRRQEARAAESKRRALAAAEAKLAQAKAIQARAAADATRAEAEAASARAALQPAEMAKSAARPVEMAPAAKAAEMVKAPAAAQSPDAPPHAAKAPEVAAKPDQASGKQVAKGGPSADAGLEAKQAPSPSSAGNTPSDNAPTDRAASDEGATTTAVARITDKSATGEATGQTATPSMPQHAAADVASEPAKVDGTDVAPTGTTKESPPAPYAAPAPADAPSIETR